MSQNDVIFIGEKRKKGNHDKRFSTYFFEELSVNPCVGETM